MENILITGGTGFVGRNLIEELIKNHPKSKIIILARNETAIQKVLTKFNYPNLTYIVGDIRDKKIVKRAVEGIDVIFHLAAMKHINFCEANPNEAITINVDATRNLVEEFKGKAFIFLSSDKAVNSSSCYGASKLLAEYLVIDRARFNKKCRYNVLRSGNIFGSDGSVIEIWKSQIENSNEIKITDSHMTRFFIPVDELILLLIKLKDDSQSGKIFVPHMKSIQMGKLANMLIDVYGNDETGMQTIGNRGGEKIHEEAYTNYEDVVSSIESSSSENAEQITSKEVKEWLTNLY